MCVPSNKKLNEREELNQRRDFAINQGVKANICEYLINYPIVMRKSMI